MTARATLPVPGLLMGNYPERPAAPSAARSRAPKQRAPRVTDVRLHETTFGALSDELLAAACQNVRRSLMREGFQPRHVALALALDSVKERQLVGVARGYVSKRRVKCVLHGKATRRKNSTAFENVQFVNA